MAIDLYWDDDEQTVILCEFNGRWTWDELHAALGTIKQLSVERDQTFGAIIDVRNGMHLPGGSIFNRDALANFRKMLSLNDGGKKGPMVILGMSAMIRTVFDTIGRMDASLTQDVAFADRIEDARRIIYSQVAALRSQSA